MDIDSTFRLRTGREVPVIGLGTWQLHDETAVTVARALDLGYRMIDTSGDYGTQPGVGRGMRSSGLGRTEIYLVTKIEEDEDSYDATKDRLRELDLEWGEPGTIRSSRSATWGCSPTEGEPRGPSRGESLTSSTSSLVAIR
jgi:aryl-alcohol dehydrogenase-like predicted oxidoreductase